MTLAFEDVDSKPLEVVRVADVNAEERVEESLGNFGYFVANLCTFWCPF